MYLMGHAVPAQPSGKHKKKRVFVTRCRPLFPEISRTAGRGKNQRSYRFKGMYDTYTGDATMKWKDWVHVTKLDPDKQLKPGDIDAIAGSGTDALMLSGTLNVTQENLSALLKQVKAYDLPLVMEPAGPEAVLTQGIDYLFVPSVLNSADVEWIVGKHRAWVQYRKGNLPWDTIVPEAYIVLNPDSSVGKVTKALFGLHADEVAAYTTVADHYFHFPIVYIEYSGTFGDPDVVKAASNVLDKAVLYYGGGINSAEKAALMAKYADTIVVGNAVYDQGAAVLKATVDAIL